MGHAVRHRDPSGKFHLDEMDTLEQALELVERLRNESAVADVRVFREVPIEVQTYYRVVAVETEAVRTGADSRYLDVSEPPAGAMPLSPASAAPAAEPASDQDATADAPAPASEPRRALFSRS